MQQIEEDTGGGDFLDLDMDSVDLSLGGYCYLLEDKEEDFEEMCRMISCKDIRYPHDANGFDFAEYLDAGKTLATIGLCISNDGGPEFFITKELMDKYPQIRETIAHAGVWITSIISLDETRKDVLDGND
jgi:hypothetical protein